MEYTSNGIDKNIRCLILLDKFSKSPIFFRTMPEAIEDVSMLKLIFSEIHSLGLGVDEIIFDADCFSENDIAYFFEQNVDFIVRIPESKKLFRILIDELTDIEQASNAVNYNDNNVFIESKKICLCNHEMFVYVVFDPEKKAKDIVMFNETFESYEEINIDNCIKYCGFLILISKNPIDKDCILPSFYSRQVIDQAFGFTDNTYPLQVCSDKSVFGYLFLVFLSSMVFINMKQSLQFHTTVDHALIILNSLKAKVYENKIVPSEQNEKIKNLFKLLDIEVPDVLTTDSF